MARQGEIGSLGRKYLELLHTLKRDKGNKSILRKWLSGLTGVSLWSMSGLLHELSREK